MKLTFTSMEIALILIFLSWHSGKSAGDDRIAQASESVLIMRAQKRENVTRLVHIYISTTIRTLAYHSGCIHTTLNQLSGRWGRQRHMDFTFCSYGYRLLCDRLRHTNWSHRETTIARVKAETHEMSYQQLQVSTCCRKPCMENSSTQTIIKSYDHYWVRDKWDFDDRRRARRLPMTFLFRWPVTKDRVDRASEHVWKDQHLKPIDRIWPILTAEEWKAC